jgi:hypothetical protein
MRSAPLLRRQRPLATATVYTVATLLLLCLAQLQGIQAFAGNGFAVGEQEIVRHRAHGAQVTPCTTSSTCAHTQNTQNIQNIQKVRSYSSRSRFTLEPLRSGSDDVDMKTVPGLKGYYVRPSRAIEKGGGFFVPGLEGGRIRVVSALFLLLLYVVNHAGTVGPVGAPLRDASEGLSEVIGLTATVLLLIQGVVELLPQAAPSAPTNSFLGVLQSRPRAGGAGGAGAGEVGVAGGAGAGAVDAVVRAMVKNLPGVNYALVADPSAVGVDAVMYELGPVSSKPSALSADGVAALKASDSFTVYSGSMPSLSSLPPTTTEMGLLQDSRGLVWVLASSSATGNLLDSKEWIEALVAAPIPGL